MAKLVNENMLVNCLKMLLGMIPQQKFYTLENYNYLDKGDIFIYDDKFYKVTVDKAKMRIPEVDKCIELKIGSGGGGSITFDELKKKIFSLHNDLA